LITVFDDEIEVDVPCDSYRHNQRFLDVIGVTNLRHFFYRKVGWRPMEQLVGTLNSRLAPDRELRDVIWVFLFTHGDECSAEAVQMGATHAVSVFARSADGMAHRYFERVDDGFQEIAELAITVKAMPDLDDVRLLHFAAFELGRLPDESAFYEFKAEYGGVEHVLQLLDPGLRTAVLVDAQKLAGAPTVGLNGHEVYTALLQQGQGLADANCGNSESCSAGTGSCEAVPQGMSAGYYCRTGVHGDAWVGVFTEAIRAGIVTLDECDFPAIRTLITEMLPRSPQGRELMAYYYVASTRFRHDRRALEEYVAILPAIRECVRGLLYGSDDAVVVTEDVRAAWARIRALHTDVPLTQERTSGVLEQLGSAQIESKADVLRVLG
jgi:hypothetical protein